MNNHDFVVETRKMKSRREITHFSLRLLTVLNTRARVRSVYIYLGFINWRGVSSRWVHEC